MNAYLTTPGGSSTAVTGVLWNQFGDATIGILADGAVTLAMIWQSAWTQGKGDTRIPAKSLTPVNKADLQTLYEDTQHPFVPSLDLDAIAAVLT